MGSNKCQRWAPQSDQAGGDAGLLVAVLWTRRAGHMGQLLGLLPQRPP